MGRNTRILAIDLGTTRCKAALIDEEGSVLKARAVESQMQKGGEGIYEQDGREFERALRRCIPACVPRLGGRVEVVSVTGQGSAPVCLDRSGKLVGPIISHLDTRASSQRELLNQKFSRLGYVPSKIFPNLLWTKENEKAEFSRIYRVLDIREYVGYLLTGEFTYDPAGMPEQSVEKLASFVGVEPSAFGVPHDYQKPIGTASDRAVRQYGLARGTPVIQAPGDTICAAIGAGVSGDGLACDVAGSTEVVATCVPESSAASDGTLYPIPHIVKGWSFLFTSPPLGVIFKWFADTFYGDAARSRRYATLDREASKTAPSDLSPTFVPFIRRAEYSYKMECEFFNLSANQTRGQMARSTMEGIAFAVRSALDRMRRLGPEPKEVRVGGGGARSRLWNQIRADAFGVDVVQTQTLEASCLGAAMVASVAVGRHKDVFEAERTMIRVTERFRPRPEARRLYESMYAGFSRRLESLERS